MMMPATQSVASSGSVVKRCDMPGSTSVGKCTHMR